MSVILVLAIFTWSQGTTVLYNSYKGHLFKSLASVSIPDVPHDMEALSKSKEFAFFTSKLSYILQWGSTVISLSN